MVVTLSSLNMLSASPLCKRNPNVVISVCIVSDHLLTQWWQYSKMGLLSKDFHIDAFEYICAEKTIWFEQTVEISGDYSALGGIGSPSLVYLVLIHNPTVGMDQEIRLDTKHLNTKHLIRLSHKRQGGYHRQLNQLNRDNGRLYLRAINRQRPLRKCLGLYQGRSFVSYKEQFYKNKYEKCCRFLS